MADLQYRSSQFNVLVDYYFEGQDLFFNTFSGALRMTPRKLREDLSAILIDNAYPINADVLSRLSCEAGIDFLVDGYAIAMDMDEREHLKKAYWNARTPVQGPLQGLGLTISPTVACNFRCSYCFEAHPERSFSDIDIRALTKFVDQKLSPEGTLGVLWFGGEPLSAFSTLMKLHDALSSVVDAKRGQFSHSMISNGFLLSKRRVDWLVGAGLGSIQITVDGPSDVHDARRPARSGRGTWDIIMSNLEYAAPRLNVCVRVNV
ncbi:MAG: radical SAM protein, partial [Myxococcota bacterium]